MDAAFESEVGRVRLKKNIALSCKDKRRGAVHLQTVYTYTVCEKRNQCRRRQWIPHPWRLKTSERGRGPKVGWHREQQRYHEEQMMLKPEVSGGKMLKPKVVAALLPY
ncbi:hypothetical protein EVAR_80655_1 [Eumeta japonica]|uniref:Uncharacterized protein n=1 Tax=Eumeta variegata TaxID=151549 RepID=A0A4C1U3K4_EUMVA|nr:hypothetical protein EVAR_80655_1 [Eumeta japonica]